MGQNNYYLIVGDKLITRLSESHGAGDEPPGANAGWRLQTLGLVTLFQYYEKLSDRQAEEASRLRIDWKYALHLPIHHPGFAPFQLCAYRQQALQKPADRHELEELAGWFAEWGFDQNGRSSQVSALEVLSQVCCLSRLDEVLWVMRRALEALATYHSEWMRKIILPPWYARYHLFKTSPDLPESIPQQQALAEAIGVDIRYLFEAISRKDQLEFNVREPLAALKRAYLDQFEQSANGELRCLTRCSVCGQRKEGEI